MIVKLMVIIYANQDMMIRKSKSGFTSKDEREHVSGEDLEQNAADG